MKPLVALNISVFVCGFLACIWAFGTGILPTVETRTEDSAEAYALVELFTSQGCSSCPRADALIAQTQANNPGVMVLSFHVDYWNRLGWKDPFSSKANTARQGSYTRHFGLRSLYTPQAVVNGNTEFTGSDAGRLRQALAKAKKTGLPHAVALHNPAMQGNAQATSGRTQQVAYSISRIEKLPPAARLHLAIVSPRETTQVRAGENGGRTLTHTHVVRALHTYPATATGHIQFTYPAGFKAGPGTLVAFLQDSLTLQVLGVGRL